MTLQNVEENVHLSNLNSFNAFLVLCDVFSLASKGIKKKLRMSFWFTRYIGDIFLIFLTFLFIYHGNTRTIINISMQI